MSFCDQVLQTDVLALNIQSSYQLAVAASVVLLFSLYIAATLRNPEVEGIVVGLSVVNAVLLSLHPAWTAPAYVGDCAMSRFISSWYVLVLMAILVVFQLMLERWCRRQSDQQYLDYNDRLFSG